MKGKKLSRLLLLFFCMLCLWGMTVHAVDSQPIELEFTKEEQQFLNTKKILKISIIEDWKPFSYAGKDGVFQGLPVLILERLSKSSGVLLEFVPAQNYSQSLEQLATGKVDMIAMMTEYTNSSANTQGETTLKLLPYLTSHATMIYHRNTELNELKVATVADIDGRLMVTNKQTISTMFFESQQECLNAVRCGQADVMLCDAFTGSTLMQRYNAKDLQSVPSTVMMGTGFGVLPKTDDRLVSALQKTIDSFTTENITLSLMEGSNYKAKGLLNIVYQYPFEIICFSLAIMFVVILILTTYTKVNVRQHQALQGYEKSYRLLSDTFGEAGLEYDYLKDSLTIFGRHANLDIDAVTNNFREKLRNRELRISLTEDMFYEMIENGVENKSFSAEFQCGVRSGEWVWYRLIYTVICTTESHRRPIRLVGCLTNIDEEHAEKERLLKLSSNDQLTGLFNHATGEKEVRSLLEQDTTFGEGLLIVLDIDVFKQFNDQKGHLCGDKVLYSLGEAAREIFEPEDILCRWGGDEFLFFLRGDHLENRTTQLEVLRQRMRGLRYQNVDCPVTLSIGGAQCYPGCTFDSLFQQADVALYLSKEKGRNQFWLYTATEQTATLGNEDNNATQII